MGDYVQKLTPKQPGLRGLYGNRAGRGTARTLPCFSACTTAAMGSRTPALSPRDTIRQTDCPRTGGKLPPSLFPGQLKAQGDQRLIFPACFSFLLSLPHLGSCAAQAPSPRWASPCLSVPAGKQGPVMYSGSPQLPLCQRCSSEPLDKDELRAQAPAPPAPSLPRGWMLKPWDLGMLRSGISQPAQEQEPPTASKDLPVPLRTPLEWAVRRQGAEHPSLLSVHQFPRMSSSRVS